MPTSEWSQTPRLCWVLPGTAPFPAPAASSRSRLSPIPLFCIWVNRSPPGAERWTPTGSDGEATQGGRQGARPARPALYRLHCWGAGRQRPPRPGRLWEAGSGWPEPPSARGQGEIPPPSSVQVGQPALRTRSHAQARPLGDAQALGSTLQMRKLRPPSYKWQIGSSLGPGLLVPSLHQA